MKLLQKIAWRTRRWNLKINFFDLFLHDGDGCWGFTLLEVVNNFETRSLLAIEFRLPNGANVKQFTIDNWDILFIRKSLYNHYSELDERQMWLGESSLTSWEKCKLYYLKKIL